MSTRGRVEVCLHCLLHAHDGTACDARDEGHEGVEVTQLVQFVRDVQHLFNHLVKFGVSRKAVG